MMLDLENASRQELIQLNLQLIARLQLLEERVKQLEAVLESLRCGSKSGPPSFIKANRPVRSKNKKRKKRARGLARKLDKPTACVEHSLDQCPQCQVPLTGRRMIKTRQVIKLPPVQVQVVEHALVERRCPNCHKGWAPGFICRDGRQTALRHQRASRGCATSPTMQAPVPCHTRLPASQIWSASKCRQISGIS
jgi:zinc-finger binding domain of transposase IS66